jgi:hypothetical protein
MWVAGDRHKTPLHFTLSFSWLQNSAYLFPHRLSPMLAEVAGETKK